MNSRVHVFMQLSIFRVLIGFVCTCFQLPGILALHPSPRSSLRRPHTFVIGFYCAQLSLIFDNFNNKKKKSEKIKGVGVGFKHLAFQILSPSNY